MKFCVQRSFDGREKLAITRACLMYPKHYSYVLSNSYVPNHVPVGTVEFCEMFLPKPRPAPDFYPDFLKQHLHREITTLSINKDNRDACNGRFVKRVAPYKSDFRPRVVTPKDDVPDGLYHVSQAVVFTQEWRYYILDGVKVAAGWYDGNDEDEPAPALPAVDAIDAIDWPFGFSGAVDFGRLDNGRFALVESHEPYACGWYGETHEGSKYAYWQKYAWQFMYVPEQQRS